MVYIVNKNKTKIIPLEKPITLVKVGMFWAIMYDGKERISCYFSESQAMKDMQKAIKALGKQKGMILLSGFTTDGANCEDCEYFSIDNKGRRHCILGDKKVLKKCSYITGKPIVKKEEKPEKVKKEKKEKIKKGKDIPVVEEETVTNLENTNNEVPQEKEE